MINRLILSLLMLFPVFAAAEDQCTFYQIDWGDLTLPWHTSKESACSAGMALIQADNPSSQFRNIRFENGSCRYEGRGNSWGEWINAQRGIREKQDKCKDQCSENAGEISTMNYTRGWARSSLANKSDQLGKTSELPSSICQGGCKFSVLGNEEAYRSQTPSDQGLYRLSSDVTVIATDQSCTPGESDKAADPTTPDLTCPGQLGQLNGKPFCAVDSGKTGVEPNGPAGTGNSTDDKGNPAAGKKPDSGEGSGAGGVGRTPSQGNGGNAGGPGGAAAGGTGTKPGGKAPDGTTDKKEGKEQENCGAPGQKPCKIDETDVPREYDPKGKDKGIDEWKTKMDAQREEIKGSGDGTFGAIEILFSAPPFAGCDYIELPNNIGTLTRQCDVVGGVRDAMAYVWALAALWICIGWIREAV